jgi:hypothetical protein
VVRTHFNPKSTSAAEFIQEPSGENREDRSRAAPCAGAGAELQGISLRKAAQETPMSKVPILYYSAYGHIETMAGAIAEGARETGAQVDVSRVPEIPPEEVARNAHFKLDQAAPAQRSRK